MSADNMDIEEDTSKLLKDAQFRRRYLKWFNKRREDFKTDQEHDDYLEMVEDILSNLVNDVDVEATKARVERYRRDNQHLIGVNQARRLEEERLEAEKLSMMERERQQQLAEDRRQDEERERQEREARMQRNAEELLRVTKGDEAVERLHRRREKEQRKKRRREAAAAREAEEKAKAETAPMWFHLQFPSMQPDPLSSSNITEDSRPAERLERFQKDPTLIDRAAKAGGFDEEVVRERAHAEFVQSLSLMGLCDMKGEA